MTTWRDLFDKKFFIIPQPLLPQGKAQNEIKAFISLTLQSAFDEVEKTLPTEKEVMKKYQTGISYFNKDHATFNQCLAEVKASIKKTKEKFLK